MVGGVHSVTGPVRETWSSGPSTTRLTTVPSPGSLPPGCATHRAPSATAATDTATNHECARLPPGRTDTARL